MARRKRSFASTKAGKNNARKTPKVRALVIGKPPAMKKETPR
jgi:hypothetical protein